MSKTKFDLLIKGLDFAHFPINLNISRIKVEFEYLYRYISSLLTTFNILLFKKKLMTFYNRYTSNFFQQRQKKSVIVFKKILNSIHNNIAFTAEMQSNNRLNFLDVLVDNSRPNPVTSTFREPTNTVLCTKWNSFVPRRYKINLINCLLDVCYEICSLYKIIFDQF